MYRVVRMKGCVDDFPLIGPAQPFQAMSNIILCNSNIDQLFITVNTLLVIFWSNLFSILIGLFELSNFMFSRIVLLPVRKIGEVT